MPHFANKVDYIRRVIFDELGLEYVILYLPICLDTDFFKEMVKYERVYIKVNPIILVFENANHTEYSLIILLVTTQNGKLVYMKK